MKKKWKKCFALKSVIKARRLQIPKEAQLRLRLSTKRPKPSKKKRRDLSKQENKRKKSQKWKMPHSNPKFWRRKRTPNHFSRDSATRSESILINLCSTPSSVKLTESSTLPRNRPTSSSIYSKKTWNSTKSSKPEILTPKVTSNKWSKSPSNSWRN